MRWPWSRKQQIEVQEIDENCVVVIQCQQKITPEQEKAIWAQAAKLREQLATPGIQIVVLDSSLTMRVYKRSWIHPTPFPLSAQVNVVQEPVNFGSDPIKTAREVERVARRYNGTHGNGYQPIGSSGRNDPPGAS